MAAKEALPLDPSRMHAGSKPRARRSLRSSVNYQVRTMPQVESDKKSPGDQARPGTKQAAENTCPKCSGSGRIDEKACPNCGGTGKVTEIVGDA
jgi:hypothetical protein